MMQADILYDLARQHRSELLLEAELQRLATSASTTTSPRPRFGTVLTRIANALGALSTQRRQSGNPSHA